MKSTAKEIKDKIHEHEYKFSKKLGQNFLVDQNTIDSIINGASITSESTVIEIGPGAGSLTKEIAKKAKEVIAYEIDPKAIVLLEETMQDFDNITIINQDFLEVNVEELPKDAIIVSNLPYYITTPIIMKILEANYKFESLIFMMQKEVGSRIIAQPNTKEYSSLSIAIQYRCAVRKLIDVSKNVFIPKPNVDSIVLRFDYEPYDKTPNNEAVFFKVVRESFGQRRKTLANNLIKVLELPREEVEDIITKAGIELKARPEQVTMDQFIELSNVINER